MKKSPIRFIYEDLFGTTIGPRDELSYYSITIKELVRMIKQKYIKKFPWVKNDV